MAAQTGPVRPHPGTGSYHRGLDAGAVVAAAVALTAESHLAAWSIRDLARRLGVAPSVVYHHVGGKDLLSRRVVEVVLAGVPVPERGLAWDVWFDRLLTGLCPPLAAHPGCAHWLLMHGPVLPDLLPVIDAGIAALLAAGFAERAGAAYSVLLNTAMATIAMSDDRHRHEDDGPRDHPAMMAELDQLDDGSTGLAVLRTTVLAPLTRPADAQTALDDYYRLVVATVIRGLDALRG